MMAAPKVGEAAPAFAATAHDGSAVRLEDFRGQWVVLYFYPKAFTPGCTVESKGFRDRRGEFEALGARIVGVSVDGVDTQCRFEQHHALGFTLIADEDATLARMYGVRRALLGTAKRVTFIIDPHGRISARLHHELRVERHVSEALEHLQAHATLTPR